MGVKAYIGQLQASGLDDFAQSLDKVKDVAVSARDMLASQQLQLVQNECEGKVADYLKSQEKDPNFNDFESNNKRFVEKLAHDIEGNKNYDPYVVSKFRAQLLPQIADPNGGFFRKSLEIKETGQYKMAAKLFQTQMNRYGGSRAIDTGWKKQWYKDQWGTISQIPEDIRKQYGIAEPESFDHDMDIMDAQTSLQNLYRDSKDGDDYGGSLPDDMVDKSLGKYDGLSDIEKETVRKQFRSYEDGMENTKISDAKKLVDHVSGDLDDMVAKGNLTRDDIDNAFAGQDNFYIKAARKSYYALADSFTDSITFESAVGYANGLLKDNPNRKLIKADFKDFPMLTSSGRTRLNEFLSTQSSRPLMPENDRAAAAITEQFYDSGVSDDQFYGNVRNGIQTGYFSGEYAQQQGWFSRGKNITAEAVVVAAQKDAATQIKALIPKSEDNATVLATANKAITKEITSGMSPDEVSRKTNEIVNTITSTSLSAQLGRIFTNRISNIFHLKEHALDFSNPNAFKIYTGKEYDSLVDDAFQNEAVTSFAGNDNFLNEQDISQFVTDKLYPGKTYKDLDDQQKMVAGVNAVHASLRIQALKEENGYLGKGTFYEVNTPYGYGAAKNQFLYVRSQGKKGWQVFYLDKDTYRDIKGGSSDSIYEVRSSDLLNGGVISDISDHDDKKRTQKWLQYHDNGNFGGNL